MLVQGLPGMEQSLLSRQLNFLSSCCGFSYLHHLHLHFLSFSCQRLKTTEGKPHILSAAHVASLINTRIGLSPNGRMNIAIFIGTMILWVMNLTGFAWFCRDIFGLHTQFHEICKLAPPFLFQVLHVDQFLILEFFRIPPFFSLPAMKYGVAMCGFLSSIISKIPRGGTVGFSPAAPGQGHLVSAGKWWWMSIAHIFFDGVVKSGWNSAIFHCTRLNLPQADEKTKIESPKPCEKLDVLYLKNGWRR